MARAYYYLVSGLPDLVLDEGKGFVSFQDFVNEAQEQLTKADCSILECIRLPFDNTNLITAIEKRSMDFDPRGNFSHEQLNASLKEFDMFPIYMQTFIEAFREGKQLFAGLTSEDQLNWLFYDEMTAHKNQFIRDWFIFELDLRNLIAAINTRKGLEHLDALGTERDRSVNSVIITRNGFAETILHSTASDFGVGSIYPWVEKVLNYSKKSLIDFEKGIDSLRWDVLNEMTTFSYFGLETVLAFAIKLTIVERWNKLDSEVGRAKLDRLVEELKNSYTIAEGF